MTWGPEGKPTLFGASLMSAGYRSDGLRAWKTLSTSTGSKNYFVYDGTKPVLELSADGGVRYDNTFGANGLLSRWKEQPAAPSNRASPAAPTAALSPPPAASRSKSAI